MFSQVAVAGFTERRHPASPHGELYAYPVYKQLMYVDAVDKARQSMSAHTIGIGHFFPCNPILWTTDSVGI